MPNFLKNQLNFIYSVWTWLHVIYINSIWAAEWLGSFMPSWTCPSGTESSKYWIWVIHQDLKRDTNTKEQLGLESILSHAHKVRRECWDVLFLACVECMVVEKHESSRKHGENTGVVWPQCGHLVHSEGDKNCSLGQKITMAPSEQLVVHLQAGRNFLLPPQWLRVKFCPHFITDVFLDSEYSVFHVLECSLDN